MLRARAASPPVDTDISPDITSLWPIYRQYYRHTFRQLSLRKVKPELARGWRYARQTLRHGIRLGICCPARAIRLRPELILRRTRTLQRGTIRRWPDVRPGRPEARHPPAARRKATARLRDHQGNRRPVWRDLFTKPGHSLSNPDASRGPRLRASDA